MNGRQAFLSAMHLFVVAAFFIAGLLFASLSYLPELRHHIMESSTPIAVTLFLTGLVLLIGFYALHRGKYLVIRMGVAADLSVVRQTVEDCFVRQFSQKIFLRDLELGNKSTLEIHVGLSPLDEDAREELFIAAEKALGTLLRERFGYAKPFHLIVKIE